MQLNICHNFTNLSVFHFPSKRINICIFMEKLFLGKHMNANIPGFS